MKTTRWLIGSIVLIGLIVATLFFPLPFWFFPEMAQASFLGRVMFILLLAAGLCIYRITLGPTSADRIVGVDILGILIVAFCALLTISAGRDWYMDIAIAWALQSFISTLALAKYLEGKGLEE